MCIEMSEPNSLKPQRGDMCIERMKRDWLIGVLGFTIVQPNLRHSEISRIIRGNCDNAF